MSNYNTQLQSNNTSLQEILELLQTKAAGSFMSLEWINCSTLPTSYAIRAPGEQSYYIELPSEKCFVLFYNKDTLSTYKMGVYDVERKQGSFDLPSIYGGGVLPAVIKDSESLSLEISNDNVSILNNTYYTIITMPSYVNLITFTIDGTEYQAEEGMTWGEWVDSEYNTDKYFASRTSIYENDGMLAVFIENGKNAKPSDEIYNINYILEIF